MPDEDYFTEKEFNTVREKIVRLFDGELAKYFSVKKSTYKWSSKNMWKIHVEVSKRWNWGDEQIDRDNSPAATLKAVSLLFKTMTDFIEDESNGFYFINVGSRGSFGFTFDFIPKVIAAKKLLSNARL